MKNSILHSIKIGVSTLILSLVFSTTSFSQDLIPSDWPNLVGYWKFQDTTDLTKATVGNDLILIGQHQWLPGAFYGDTAIRIDTGNYYKVYHGISANGGGDSVNQYTLMYDFRVLSFNHWHCFQQTDTTNQNDADCFIKPIPDSLPGMIGVGFTGYSDTSIVPNQWYRLVISVNLGHFYNYYLNGVLIHTGDTDEIQIDDRFALTEAILFFADNNHEDDTIDVGSIALFDTCLTPSQIAQIGSIDPCVANPPIVNLGNDTTICGADSLVLSIPNTYESYLWSTGDTTSQIVLDSSNFGLTSDTIWAMATDINNCQTRDTLMLSFATAHYFYMPTDTMDCFFPYFNNDTVFYLSIDSTFDSYQWSTGDTSWAIKINMPSLGVGKHLIWAKVTDNNCSSTKSMNLTIDLCESIEEINKPSFEAFPNPTSGNIQLKLNEKATFIRVYNAAGQIVAQYSELNIGMHNLDFSLLPEGLYIMEVQGEKGKSYSKIIIQR